MIVRQKGVRCSNSNIFGGAMMAWDTSNDQSIADLPFGHAQIEQTPRIPVYDADVLIYGMEM